MKHLKKLKTKSAALIVLILFSLCVAIILTYQKISYLTAGPEDEKDCVPVNPNDDSDKKVNILDSIVPQPIWSQKRGYINDASCLDKTSVHGIVDVKSEEDIKKALLYAKQEGLKVSVAAVKHSMGGQAFSRNGVILNMLNFNAVSLNESEKTVTVQAGATWHQIQNKIHPKYAIKAMQSTDIFSVGGSISVNAHGMDHQVGSIAKTIRSIRIMHPDGTIEKISSSENPKLFNLVIGGYGLFGVILDAELAVTDNVIYDYKHKVLDYKEFPSLFENEIKNNKKIGLMYAHLSTAPNTFLKEMLLYTYTETDNKMEILPLGEPGNVKLRRLFINLSKQNDFSKWLKWFAEKDIEPLVVSCTLNRNQALKDGESCLVSRNEPMHDSVKYLQNNLKNDTDILHEYFIPREKLIEFIDRTRAVLQNNNANVLNASVRVVHKEDIALNYAPEDMFSLVLYLNQTADQKGNERMKKLTAELIALTNEMGGRFFLPYQLHYEKSDLEKSYPEIHAFFQAKKQYDPEELLTNTFYQKYSQID